MSGKRRAACPVGDEHRPWFHEAAGWLVDSLGAERVRGVVVALPTQEHFPGAFDTTETSMRRLFPLVCARMGVDPDAIRLEVVENPSAIELHAKLGLYDLAGQEHGWAGIYDEDGRPRVRFDRTLHASIATAIATLAHELGHFVLLGEKRLDGDEEDHELLTEMTTVFLGMGVFNANSYTWQTPNGAFGGLGYFDASQWGYTLALFAWFRGETDPAWARHLRPDIATPFREGLRFLAASGLAPGSLPPP